MGKKSNLSYTHHIRWFELRFFYELSHIGLLLMIQVQILVGGLHKCYLGSDDVIRGHQQVFANNSQLKRSTDMGVVSLCSSCQDASIDCNLTYLDQHVASRDLDLRSNIDLTSQGHQVCT